MVENKGDFEFVRAVERGTDVSSDVVDDDLLADDVTVFPPPSAPPEEEVALPPPSYEEAIVVERVIQEKDTSDASPEPAVTNESDDDRQSKMVASGTTAAFLGFLFFGGPFGAVILGFTTAYASQKEGAAGDIARMVGEIGVSIKEKFQRINDKHHLVDRSMEAASKAWVRAKAYDKEHRVLDKIVVLLQQGLQQLLQFIRDHRVLEQGMECAERGYVYLAERLSEQRNAPTSDNSQSIPATSSTSNRSKPSTRQSYQRVPGYGSATAY